ncbi:ABC transporter substrate-binding protein [Pseudodesulfovibrio sediminis]|uniref:Sugar ABC transporter substrate-binding protein n=1 Tax=Pseudodesulfovibrio sediminis TaxID=2810563 RepID=A0ABM7P8D4_9BACT|nr:hypothetical protein [Pseudodesulfovibrio sediminis]BCS89161.1 hypothetical protein PSDVSF_24030 [Pseudodesulfovibrio sediminis]
MSFRHISVLAALLFLLAWSWEGEAHARRPLVMIINSYSLNYSWVRSHNEGLTYVLGADVDLSIHYLDTKRLAPEEYQGNVDRAWAAVQEDRPDVVVLTDDNAIRLLGRRVMDAGIPVVFLGVSENPRVYLDDMKLATGVLERPLFKRSILYFKDILGPTLQRALILFDTSNTSQTIMNSIFKGKRSHMLANTAVEVLLLETFEEWQQAILTVENTGNNIVFAGLYHNLKDANGQHVPSETVIRWTSAHSPVPVFGFWDFSVGKGKAVGGLVNSGRTQGEDAARLVQQILTGTEPKELYPITAENGIFLFSFHELDRWGLVLPYDFHPMTDPVYFVE